MATAKDLRTAFPRSRQAELPPTDRDPVAILDSQNATRLQELVPVRFGRMLQSPFAFYRGAAALMATDLAAGGSTNVPVVSCGDAHISNFGFFASPERTLLFDLNDFDEAGIAPWEWDVKRLVASIYIGARENSMSEDACYEAARTAAARYREVLGRMQGMTALERYYSRVDATMIESFAQTSKQARKIRKVTAKARGRTSEQVLDKIGTVTEDGELLIVDDPPILQHTGHASHDRLQRFITSYTQTVRADISQLLQQYRVTDYALRVVGVGSVGTRCYIVALQGPSGDPLFIQIKEAGPSVLVTYGGMPQTIPGVIEAPDHTEGHRVVAGQRILQSQSDPFLGWIVGYDGAKGEHVRVDYYLRQFRDMKGSIDLSSLKPDGYRRMGEVCAALLARAHSQSVGAAQASAYLGSSAKTDGAFATWARGYADVNERDYETLAQAAKKGDIPAEFGV